MQKDRSLYRSTQIVWYIFSAIQAVLLFRFLLKLLGANPAAAFTEIVYSISGTFLAPFMFVFEANNVGGSTVEWSTLLAVAVYWFMAWGITKLLSMWRTVSISEARQELEMQEKYE